MGEIPGKSNEVNDPDILRVGTIRRKTPLRVFLLYTISRQRQGLEV